MFECMTRYYAKCVMEVRLYVSWKFVYMCHGSSFICAMEVRLYVPWKFIYMCYGASFIVWKLLYESLCFERRVMCKRFR